MLKRILKFFTEKPCTSLPDAMTETEWQELLENGRNADKTKLDYMYFLKKNSPKKYHEMKILESFTMGM